MMAAALAPDSHSDSERPLRRKVGACSTVTVTDDHHHHDPADHDPGGSEAATQSPSPVTVDTVTATSLAIFHSHESSPPSESLTGNSGKSRFNLKLTRQQVQVSLTPGPRAGRRAASSSGQPEGDSPI